MSDKQVQTNPKVETPNFCETCGHSLKPLKGVHQSRTCPDCSKTIFFVQSDLEGKGIKLEAGDKLHIPNELLQPSLDPASITKLYRPGLSVFIELQFFDGRPNRPEDIKKLCEYYENKFDSFLKESEMLQHLDLETEEGGKEAYKILEQNKHTREWWALLSVSFARIALKKMESNEIEHAIYSIYMATNAHAMTVIKEKTFEDTLWRGYLANRAVYESAAAAANTPALSEAIKNLNPLFSNLEESILHAFVHDGNPIGPRINVKELPEETIHALAEWHLESFSRKREDEHRAKSASRDIWNLRFQGIGIAIALGAAVGSILKYFGVI